MCNDARNPIFCIISAEDLGSTDSEETLRFINISEQVRLLRATRLNPASLRPVALIPDGETRRPDRHILDQQSNNRSRREGEPASGVADVDTTYDHLGTIHRFFAEHFRRDSVDGNGKTLKANVRVRKIPNRPWTQALWTEDEIQLGEGDNNVFQTFADDLSIIAHEYMHGVNEHSGGLGLYDQAGALNESLADIFACLVVQFSKNQQAHEASWLVGENALVGTSPADPLALRSLATPGACRRGKLSPDKQPFHMNSYFKTDKDHGGIHINSGIPNHAFYLLARYLGGHAWEKAGKIWYNTLEKNNNPTIGFSQWAAQTVEEAEDIFGRKSIEAIYTRRSWQMVGVRLL